MTAVVTDSGIPPLSATNSFSVLVGDFAEWILGSAVVRAGQSGSVSVTMNSSAGVTNLNFLLEAPEDRLTNFALQLFPPDVAGSLQATGPNRSFINLRLRACLKKGRAKPPLSRRLSNSAVLGSAGTPRPTLKRFLKYALNAAGGAPLMGSRELSTLAFTATTNEPSAIVPLSAFNLAATQGNGVPLPRTIANNGRVVIVGTAPLLEALIQTNSQRTLILYGIPQTAYRLESTANFSAGVTWNQEWQGTLTNLFQTFDVSTTNQTIFFRARE